MQRGWMRYLWPAIVGALQGLILFVAIILAMPARAAAEEGIASFYGGRLHGGPTASGERFNQNAMTAAHRRLPLGSRVKVTNIANGKTVMLRINDRGPFVRGRIIDVSRGAAGQLGFVARGLARVRVERVD